MIYRTSTLQMCDLSVYPECPGECEGQLSSVCECSKEVTEHLRSLNSSGGIMSECSLILSRIGLFGEVPFDQTVCQKHRVKLGLGWKRTSVYCKLPKPLSQHENLSKADRGVTHAIAHVIYENYGLLVPVGTGKCKKMMFLFPLLIVYHFDNQFAHILFRCL